VAFLPPISSESFLNWVAVALAIAAPVALLPGEIATFRLVAYDDNALTGRGMAVSPAFELRFPSLADLYDRMDERQGAAQSALERAAERLCGV